MSVKRFNMKSKPMLNREELLQSIVRDRSLLNDYFENLATRESQTPRQKLHAGSVTTKVQQRDSYDLFFESACISIKSLPPKLAAEAKSRISQIITEFELRAISEEEAQREKAAKVMRVTSEPVVDPTSGIVYEFQAYT